MLKKIILLTLMTLVVPFSASAYSPETTHAGLTDEIVDFYNSSFPNKPITPEQKEWIVQGSIDEDTPPRWINHFYDPIRKIGWSGEKAGTISPELTRGASTAFLSWESPRSAVDWAVDFIAQPEYGNYGGNHTWQKALEYYANSNLKEAYITLGHILHLLEDMSVPEHTRDDTHAEPVGKITGDPGSPYETYATRWTRQTIKTLGIAQNLKKENMTPPNKSSIGDYLVAVAEYSNKYFFSKDTINDLKYPNPKIVREDENFGYGVDENGKEFPLAKIKETEVSKFNFEKNFIIEKIDAIILDAYFPRLSKQAVLYGAGAIKLFQQQAEDAVVAKDYPTRLVKYNVEPFLALQNFSLLGWLNKAGEAAKDATAFIGGRSQTFLNTLRQAGSNTLSTITNTKHSNILKNVGMLLGRSKNESKEITQQEQKTQPPVRTSSQEEQTEEIPPTLWEEMIFAQKTNTELERIIAEANKNTVWEETRGWEQAGGNAETRAETKREETKDKSSAQKEQSEDKAQAQPTSSVSVSSGTGSGGGAVSTPPPTFIKVLISEVQVSGATANNEFVELYNPNSSSVNLAGWKLIKKTSGGNDHNLVSSQSFSGAIPAKSYFLIAHPDYAGATAKNLEYSNRSSPLARDNTVLLYDSEGRLVDKLGWGSATTDFEGSVFANNPASGQSIERKANVDSTSDSLATGEDRYAGNGYDTDNNANDFTLRLASEPQNSSNFKEPRSSPSRITDLTVATTSATTVLLSWTTPSDNDSSQSQLRYYIRYATSTITEASWSNATSLASSSVPSVGSASSSASTTASGLSEGTTYYFGIKTEDETQAFSLLSNIPSITLTAPPSTPPTTREVVINEIAWAGTASSTNDEWLELYNNTASTIDLAGWNLTIDGATSTVTFARLYGSPPVATTTIGGGEFWIFERTNNDPISTILADTFFTGAINNDGAKLELRNASGTLVDLVDASSGWFAGINEGTQRRVSMERINPASEGSTASNWASNDEITTIGLDSGGNPILGTPRMLNSRNTGSTPWNLPSIADLSAEEEAPTATLNNIALRWQVTSAMRDIGISKYDIRYATTTISTSTWNDVRVIRIPYKSFSTSHGGCVSPTNCPDSSNIQNLSENIAHSFAIRLIMNDGRLSRLSNIVNYTILPPPPTQPPDAVKNMFAQPSPPNEETQIALRWTAQGDPDSPQSDIAYDIRYSTSTITEGGWNTTQSVPTSTIPAVSASGTTDALTIIGLEPTTTYFFGVRVKDSQNNLSPLATTTAATLAPPPLLPTIGDLKARNGSGVVTRLEVQLRWTAPVSTDSRISLASYQVVASTTTPTDANWTSLNPRAAALSEVSSCFTSFGCYLYPTLSAPGSYQFAVRSVDNRSRLSSLSNLATCNFDGANLITCSPTFP